MRVIPWGDQITMPTVSSGPFVSLTAPLSIAVWVWRNVDTLFNGAANWVRLSSQRVMLRGVNDIYGEHAQFFVKNSDATTTSVNSTNYSNIPSTRAWHHLCGTYDLSTMTLYTDGSSVGSVGNTKASFVVASDSVFFGSTSEQFDGALAEAALWSAALTTDEVTALAKGVRPIVIRPEALVYYVPLLSQDYLGAPLGPYIPEPELAGNGGAAAGLATIVRNDGYGASPPVDWAPGAYLGVPPT